MAKIYSRYNQRSNKKCQYKYRPSSLYTITSYSRDSIHSYEQTANDNIVEDDSSYEGSYSSLVDEMPSAHKVCNGQTKVKTKSSLNTVCEKTPVYVHSYCKYGCGQPYQPKTFASYYDERTEYLSKKFNSLSLTKKPCKADCPIHSNPNTTPKCLTTKVDEAVIKQLEESYWAKWKPSRDSTTNRDTNNKVKPNIDRNKTNRQMRTEDDCAKKQTCEQCGMLEKCKECLKYIQREKDVQYIHKKEIDSESSMENHITSYSVMDDDETNSIGSESNETIKPNMSPTQRKSSQKPITKLESTRGIDITKSPKKSSDESGPPHDESQRKSNFDDPCPARSGKVDSARNTFCECSENTAQDLQSNHPHITKNEMITRTPSEQFSVISNENEMNVYHFDRLRPDFSAISEVVLKPQENVCRNLNSKSNNGEKLNQLKQEISNSIQPCKADCTAACKQIIENDILPLKHTDSYILNVKRSNNDKPHYQQPTAIKLSNTHNQHNNAHKLNEVSQDNQHTQNQSRQSQLSQNQPVPNQPVPNQLRSSQISQNIVPENQVRQGQLPQNQVRQGQLPQNQLPDNQVRQGQVPQNQIRSGQLPQSQPPDNQVRQGPFPQNQLLDNQVRQGQVPQNQVRPGQLPQSQPPDNQVRQGQFPQNQVREGQLPQNQLTQNQVRPGQLPQNQVRQRQLPQNQLPDNQVRQGQLPQNQVRPGQLPQNQVRQGQLPQNQLPQNLFPQNQPNNITQNLLNETVGRTRLTTKLHSYPLRPILRKRPTSSVAKRKF